MRSIKVRCPNPTCHAVLSIPPQLQGQKVRCAGCEHSFFVPPALARIIPLSPSNEKKQYRRAV